MKKLSIILIGLLFLSGCISDTQNIPSINLEVTNYYGLNNFFYEGDFKLFQNDTYKWYQSVEDNEGIYLINTSYYQKELLDKWKEKKLYNEVPQDDFWYFRASPSYVKSMGIEVDDKVIQQAKNGVRVYLIPDTLNEKQSKLLQEYLIEDALKHVDDSFINTKFVQNKQITFETYEPKGPYFTWPSNSNVDLECDAPIILLTTTANMKYFESESLNATGVDNYIKFDDQFIYDDATLEFFDKYQMVFIKSNDIYKKAQRQGYVDVGIDLLFK